MKEQTLIQQTIVGDYLDEAISKGFTVVSAQGSSRSGKTYNIAMWLIECCMMNAGTKLVVVRATRTALKATAFIDFKDILIRVGNYNEKWLNKSEMVYTFPNGSTIEFTGADNEQKLRGLKSDIVFINEANELSYISYQQLKMRCRKFVIIDYNPSFSEEHWISTIVNADKENTFHFITTYKDNVFLEETIVREIESLQWKNPTLWQVYGLGRQAVIEGLVFPNIEIIDEFPKHIKKVGIGMDFGYSSDPTAIVKVGADSECLYLEEICYRTEMLTNDIIRELKEVSEYKVISESADPRLVQEIYRAGINIYPVQKYKGSIEAGLNKMKEYRICITKDSVNLIKEFKNYTYLQDKEGKWLNQPIDAWNHGVDSARYWVLHNLLGGEKKPINKKKINSMLY